MSREIERYLELLPGEYPYLESLAVCEIGGAGGPEIALVMTFYGAGGGRIVVRCAGVRDLVFNQPWTTDMKLHSLEVTDLGSAQIEGVRFAVRDLEEEVLEFKSRTLEAERAVS